MDDLTSYLGVILHRKNPVVIDLWGLAHKEQKNVIVLTQNFLLTSKDWHTGGKWIVLKSKGSWYLKIWLWTEFLRLLDEQVLRFFFLWSVVNTIFTLGKLDGMVTMEKKLRGGNLTRWIFAVQVRLVCLALGLYCSAAKRWAGWRLL